MRHLCTLTAASLLVFLGCTRGAGKLEYGLNIKETIRVNAEQEPPSLDFEKATDTTSSLILNNIMEGLTEYNLSDPNLKLVPALATEWMATNGAKTWTLTMRKGVKWTDGVEFTAQQVVDGWERLLNPKTAAEYAYFLFNVKNAKAYNEGKITDFNEVGVKVNKEGQLVVELNSAMSYFPYLLTHHSTFPVRKDIIEKFGDKWTEPKNIVTLGAYYLKIWDHDKALVLERNEKYYGEKAKIKNILAYCINEYSTAMNLYNSGKLDFQHTLPLKELSQFQGKPDYKRVGVLQSYYYGFNTKKPPFDNLKVRKAFVQGIDRKQITDLLAAGMKPLSGWVPEGMPGFVAGIGLPFDPAKAAKLLDEAGFKDRSKLPKITIGFNTNENHQRVAENVQAQLKKNLGVDVQISNEEWKVYLSRLKSDPPQIYRMGWLADYPDPDNFLNLMTSYSENNHTYWKNPTYDKLIEDGASITEPAKRLEVYSRAQKILTKGDLGISDLHFRVAFLGEPASEELSDFQYGPDCVEGCVPRVSRSGLLGGGLLAISVLTVVLSFANVPIPAFLWLANVAAFFAVAIYLAVQKSMVKFVIRRIGEAIAVVCVIATLTFILLRVLPGGPFDSEKALPPEIKANIEAKYHLNEPLIRQYGDYMWGLLHGDLGQSYKYIGRDISDIISETLPNSIQLGVYALLIAYGLGIPLGVYAASNHGKWIDSVLMIIAISGVSLPSFLVAPLFIMFFCFQLGWLEPALWDGPAYYIMPMIVLGIRPAAEISRLTRASVLEVIRSDYIRTARAKGLEWRVILFKHVLRNSLIPVLTLSGPLVAAILTGSFVIEQIFAIPGVAKHLVQSVTNRDYPLILGTTLVFSMMLVFANLLTDLLIAAFDPRVKMS